MSSGRLFQSFGPTEANERSPTVARRDGRTSSWLEVADRRRRRDGKSATRRRRSDRYKVQCREELGVQGPPVHVHKTDNGRMYVYVENIMPSVSVYYEGIKTTALIYTQCVE